MHSDLTDLQALIGFVGGLKDLEMPDDVKAGLIDMARSDFSDVTHDERVMKAAMFLTQPPDAPKLPDDAEPAPEPTPPEPTDQDEPQVLKFKGGPRAKASGSKKD